MADRGNPRTNLQSKQWPGTVLASLTGGPATSRAASSVKPTPHTCETDSTTGHWHRGLWLYFFLEVFTFKGVGGLQRLMPAQGGSCYFMVHCAGATSPSIKVSVPRAREIKT